MRECSLSNTPNDLTKPQKLIGGRAIRVSILSLVAPVSEGLAHRQVGHACLLALEPIHLDKLLAVLVKVLIRRANGAIRHTSHATNLPRTLSIAKQMGGKVNTGSSNRERRTTCKISNALELVRESLRDLDVDLLVQAQLGAETGNEVDGVRRTGLLVAVRIRGRAFTENTVNTCTVISSVTEINLPPCCMAALFSSLPKNFSSALKVRPISFFETLVSAKISRNVRPTPDWRHAIKMQPAIMASWDFPLKAFASSTILKRCFAKSAAVFGIWMASQWAPISLYAARRFLVLLSWEDLFWVRWRSRLRPEVSPKAIVVESWDPLRSGLAPSPTRDGSSLPWSSFANVRHSERVSTMRSPKTRPQSPQTMSPDENSSTRFGGKSLHSLQIICILRFST